MVILIVYIVSSGQWPHVSHSELWQSPRCYFHLHMFHVGGKSYTNTYVVFSPLSREKEAACLLAESVQSLKLWSDRCYFFSQSRLLSSIKFLSLWIFSMCMHVTSITQKDVFWFGWNLTYDLGMTEGRTD